MFGAAAMSLSSVFVVGNALRLRGFKSGFAKKKLAAKGSEGMASGSAKGSEGMASGSAKESAESEMRVAAETQKQESEEKKMTKVITIEGMMCGHCTGRVQKALEEVAGVSAVTMSLENKTATVELNGEVTDQALTAAVTEAGYEVKGIA